MIKPKVSILCLTYNQEKYIAETLDSFLNQKTNFDIEIIINDDASTDDTVKIIKEYQKKHNNIRAVFQKQNQFSRGIRGILIKNLLPLVRGEYIAICDGDDYFSDTRKLQKQINFLENNLDYTICFHRVKVVNEDHSDELMYPNEKDLANFDLKQLLRVNFIPNCSVVYRKLDSYEGITSANISPADWYLHIFHARAGRIGYLVDVMSVYRNHKKGIWWNYIKNKKLHSENNMGYEFIFLLEVLRILSPEEDLADIYMETLIDFVSSVHDSSIDNLKKAIKENYSVYRNELIFILDRLLFNDSKLRGDIVNGNSKIISQEREIVILGNKLKELENEKMKMANSFGWRVLEYLRSIKYPQNFYHRNIRLTKTIIKKFIPKFFWIWLRELSIFIKEAKTDQKIKKDLKKVIQGADPIISVAIPIYDREKELEEAIESVLNQSFQDFELLLVTDGSPSGTLEVVRKYQNNPKVRIIEYPSNSGNSVRGRNKAILEARGKYLAFLDSDDIALKDRLRDTVATFEGTGADVIYGGYEFLVVGDREVQGAESGKKVLPISFAMKDLKKANYLFNSATAVRTEFVRKVGGLKPEMKYCEDYELWLRMLNAGAKFFALKKTVIKYRVHAGNLELSFKKDEKKWINLSLQEYKNIPELPTRVAYILPTTGIGGGVAVACEHANRLVDRGYDLTFIIDPVYADNYDLSWFPNQKVPLVEINNASSCYDIAIATGWTTAHTLEIIKATRRIYFVQSDERRFTEVKSTIKKIEETYRMQYEFMTEAKWIKKWLKEEFGKDAHLVPNAVNEKIFFRSDPLEPKGEKLRVLLEGPIDIGFKGMADAFEVVKDLDCEVWCVSSLGNPKPEWRCDKFFEKIPQQKMREVYSSCDVILKLSRVEGFFGPPLEMMACGGTAVVGDVTGYDEYIVAGKNALVVKLGDLESAKKAIQKLINDRSLLENLKKEGLKTAKAMNWEKSVDLLEKLLK